MDRYRFFRWMAMIGVWQCFFILSSALASNRIITDAAGRQVEIPQTIEYVICSGPGALRLLT